jgi:hypothetical protein
VEVRYQLVQLRVGNKGLLYVVQCLSMFVNIRPQLREIVAPVRQVLEAAMLS